MAERKHTKEDLAQMQALPLESKIEMTRSRIAEWHDAWNGNVYVSFSGGKDSTVLKHIVDSMYRNVPSIYFNTGLEYPEVQSFVRKIKSGYYECLNSNIEIIRPEMRFDEVIQKYGYPVISKEVAGKFDDYTSAKRRGRHSYVEDQLNGTYVTKNGKTNLVSVKKWKPLTDAPFLVSKKCCDIMKKKPAKEYERATGRKPFLGNLASESMLRRKTWMNHGCNAFEADRKTSSPMSFWIENDVLEYVRKYNVPLASVYGNIVPTGNIIQKLGGVRSSTRRRGWKEPVACSVCSAAI